MTLLARLHGEIVSEGPFCTGWSTAEGGIQEVVEGDKESGKSNEGKRRKEKQQKGERKSASKVYNMGCFETHSSKRERVEARSSAKEKIPYTVCPFLRRSAMIADIPFLLIVLSTLVLMRRLTYRFSSGNQKRFFRTIFGKKRLFVTPVVLRPIPFFFFAIPRRVMLLPTRVRFPLT